MKRFHVHLHVDGLNRELRNIAKSEERHFINNQT